ncbi:unnamed protein product [Pseudo-nitzschia multistriata]|uniref:Polysaccharide biosynthesis protein C-terminal domain-containing protein n=1 Tax=Pseudo-nitzschia multistriata TaxID=183589 RepID=A0A448ZLP6_9STRA|nr:unnamed protein product [Pseudo-nitzschia multistriata]VEU42969.1 unnamed protein product [Pseudo-nitzschia multistriata]
MARTNHTTHSGPLCLFLLAGWSAVMLARCPDALVLAFRAPTPANAGRIHRRVGPATHPVCSRHHHRTPSQALFAFTEEATNQPPEDPAVNGSVNGSAANKGGGSSTTTDHKIARRRKRDRLLRSLPLKGDDLDRTILKTCIPTVMNLMVVPLVNSVDTFWVGRLGVAMALAGQSAANQACFTLFFLIAFLPNMTAPLVSEAISSGDDKAARERVCESLFLSNLLGAIGTLGLVAFPRQILTALLLPADSPVLAYAAPYLRWRALGMVPSLVAATGSAAYRGLLDTVTPLKVSLLTNGVNLLLDPLLIFGAGRAKGLGFVGAAMATAASETLGGAVYIRLLLKRGLARARLLLRPPPMASLLPLLTGGAAMLLRQLALNVSFLVATRRASVLDSTGVAGAAYGITMQIYSVGIIALVGMQGAAAALVPSFRGAKEVADPSERDQNARNAADRLLGWSSLAGLLLGIGQTLLLPVLVPLFSTLPEVREAVKTPSLIASLIHVVNGPVLAGEGIMMGVGAYRALATVTMGYVVSMFGCLTFTPLGKRLDGIMWSILVASLVQQIGVVGHYLRVGPLAVARKPKTDPPPMQGSGGGDDGGGGGEAPRQTRVPL